MAESPHDALSQARPSVGESHSAVDDGRRAVEGRFPVPDCGTFDIRIDREGSWFHEGAPIRRPAMVRLFARILERDEAGDYWLATPAERGRITVEDAPFVAVELLSSAGEGRPLTFRTNLDELVDLGPAHPLRIAYGQGGEPRPYILVRGRLEARLTRSAFYELVELGRDETIDGLPRFGVWSRGYFADLGPAPAEPICDDASMPVSTNLDQGAPSTPESRA